MKQNRSEHRIKVQKQKGKATRRKEMARFPRFLMILLAFVLLAASLLAVYARFYDVVVPLPTPAYRFSRNAEITYQVHNKQSDFLEQTTQGMDLVYLSEYARLVLPAIDYRIEGDNIAAISGKYQMVAIVRVFDRANTQEPIYKETLPLSDSIQISLVDSGLRINESAQIDLASINEFIENLDIDAENELSYELEAGLQTDLLIQDAEKELIRIQERPGLVMPLGNDTFTIDLLELNEWRETIWQMRRWQLELTPMPIWIYPVAIGLSLMLLIFFLVVTKPREKPKFNRQLRKMMRKARGSLMLIGDKAWEPEWCIAASNYNTMVKTARKLKHPVFCYIDRESNVPSAYFYVYYGENNYCYIYTGKPDRKWYKETKQGHNHNDSEVQVNEPVKPLIDLPEAVKTTINTENQEENFNQSDDK